jgi:triosephosphate isomerase (TIM)
VRIPIIAANWKMFKNTGDARRFVQDFLYKLRDASHAQVVIAPPFTALEAVRGALAGSSVRLAAQNVHPEPQGAFTGEVSAAMLVDAGCSHVIVGHSERRQLFGDTDEFVARKVAAAQQAGLRPIVCVGETLAEREGGRTAEVVQRQIDGSLASADRARAADLIVAYEPVWAIGTGRTATPQMAQEAHALIRKRLAERFGSAADAIRILYGGSVKPDNARTLLAEPDIDGALVGGASLDPESFYAIVRFDRPA